MHDALFEHLLVLDDAHLLQLAEQVGVDARRSAEDLAKHRYARRVREDYLSGVRSGVRGTPTFFINERRFDDAWDLESLTSALEEAVQQAATSG